MIITLYAQNLTLTLDLNPNPAILAPTLVLSNAWVLLSSDDATSPGHLTLIFS